MNDDMNNGGPAFPQNDLSAYGIGPPTTGVVPGDEYSGRYEVSGMSLRDWFAGQALANVYTFNDGDPDKVAMWAYQVADAMLAARAKVEAEE